MEHTYTVTGMTCQGCASSVMEKLSKVDGVREVNVDLEQGEAKITMKNHVPLQKFQSALSEKYGIEEKGNHVMEMLHGQEKSKWVQLRPLFLIFAYLFSAAFLLNFKDWSISEAMLDFMGLFYVVFSFFKFLDLKGFPESFGMYDPLAKVLPIYGWVYPFMELGLGILFLMRIQIQFALIVTVVILGITTLGVTKTLLDKKSIRCACLGTALNLPMTEATFIENAIMLVMAVWMLMI
ncbi:heavy-metal-associated domain-containing protein [Flagellimonas nanhaiensis]|uniref:Heavy metal transporter n=1 Tax=Flagellimonas nanhaiensis TaxID=2292706 RepID=A0A371JPA0_9FLAO|nr:heavy metal-associated domain-containing protein [Allomuricauda nanhaiensis]RDY59348.1 heavy metal transporter [Allomuricauda nanhaiensis]